MSDPLFKDTDAIEETYVGRQEEVAQPNQPPRVFRPEQEGSTLTTPPLRSDESGIRSEPIFQGSVGQDNAISRAPQLDPPPEAEE